jgi:CheY-like chemotaxis protein
MTVIVTVEDEFLTSDYLGGILEDAGYEVVATSNADEAIAILEARNDIRIAESEPMRSPIPTHPGRLRRGAHFLRRSRAIRRERGTPKRLTPRPE